MLPTPLSASAWDATGDADALLEELMDEAANETDALLAELLGEQPAWQTPADSNEAPPIQTTTTTPATAVTNAAVTEAMPHSEQTAPVRIPQPRQASASKAPVMTRTERAKQTVNSLRMEVSQLTRELKRLRGQGLHLQPHGRSSMEVATVERHKRRRAEDECRQLRSAVYLHAKFIRSLRSVFTITPPPLTEGLNLSRYLHDYVRLPRDRSTRRTEYEALSRDERLSLAIEILSRETDAISFDTPHIHTEFLPSSDGFAVTTLSVYAVNTTDISAVLRGACVAVRDIVARWPQCEPLDVTRQIVDADEAVAVDHHLLYRLVSAKHKHTASGAELSVQARATTFYRMRDDDAVMIWDFVDEDELYPIAADTADLTRKSIGALFMRRELCGDGVERIVCRSICTKRYTVNSTRSPTVLDQFVDAAKASLRPNGRVFYEIVTQQVAEEEALVAHLS